MTTVYARWYPMNEPSIGYALRLCDGCVEDHIVPAILAIYRTPFNIDSCAMCAGGTVDRFLYTWITSYARGEEPLRQTLETCEPCAIRFRVPFLDSGRQLDDRPLDDARGTPSFWKAIGVEPKNAA